MDHWLFTLDLYLSLSYIMKMFIIYITSMLITTSADTLVEPTVIRATTDSTRTAPMAWSATMTVEENYVDNGVNLLSQSLYSFFVFVILFSFFLSTCLNSRTIYVRFFLFIFFRIYSYNISNIYIIRWHSLLDALILLRWDMSFSRTNPWSSTWW